MPKAFKMKLAWIVGVAAVACLHAAAQAPGVPICSLGRLESQSRTGLVNTAKDLFSKGDGLGMSAARKRARRPRRFFRS